MNDLDDLEALSRADPGGLLKLMDDFLGNFATAYESAATAKLRRPAEATHVVLSGMGGSGIGGNLVSRLVESDCPLPITARKDYGVPAFVGPKSLVFCVSYSGETEETLDVALQARDRGANLIGISSGGRLQKVSSGAKAQFLNVPTGRQPRAALPELFGTLLGSFRALGLTNQGLDASAHKRLSAYQKSIAPSSPSSRNEAKRAAKTLQGKTPVFYAGPELAPVALRGRCQVNENAKVLAREDILPEANHNDLVPWDAVSATAAKDWCVVALRTHGDVPEIKHRFDFLLRTLDRRGVAHVDHVSQGESSLERMLRSLLFVDYLSYYAALINNVDPSPVAVIGELKALLAKSGKAPSLHARITELDK